MHSLLNKLTNFFLQCVRAHQSQVLSTIHTHRVQSSVWAIFYKITVDVYTASGSVLVVSENPAVDKTWLSKLSSSGALLCPGCLPWISKPGLGMLVSGMHLERTLILRILIHYSWKRLNTEGTCVSAADEHKQCMCILEALPSTSENAHSVAPPRRLSRKLHKIMPSLQVLGWI